MIQKSIKLILFLETIKNYNVQLNRNSSGGPGKKLGEKLAEKASENLSKPSSSSHLPNITTGKMPTSPSNLKEKPKFSKPKPVEETYQKIPIIKKQPLENKIPHPNSPSVATEKVKNFTKNEEKNYPLPTKTNLKEKFIKENYKKSKIPEAPPLPKVPLVKPKKIEVDIICPDTLESAKKNLKHQHHIPIKTKINDSTKPIDLSKVELLEEIVSRGMAKVDNNKPIIANLKDENGNQITIGEHIKINSLGLAYLNELELAPKLQEKLVNYNSDDYEFFLSVPIPKISEETCLYTGKQSHIITIVVKKKDSENNNDEYFVIGYLTSQKTGILMSKTQFEKFQENLENPKDNKNPENQQEKSQYFKPLRYLESIQNDEFIKLKYNKEYLYQEKKIIEKLKDQHAMLIMKGYKIYNPTGYTREDLLEISKKYDSFRGPNYMYLESIIELAYHYLLEANLMNTFVKSFDDQNIKNELEKIINSNKEDHIKFKKLSQSLKKGFVKV